MSGRFYIRAIFLIGLAVAHPPATGAQSASPEDTLSHPGENLPTGPKPNAKKIRRRPSVPFFSGQFILGTTYDNNVLNYSPRDVELFLSGSQPARFAIKSPDDVIYGVELQLDFRPSLWTKHPTRLRLTTSGDLYFRNGIKNQGQVGLELRQSLSRKATVEAAIDYLPFFYLRNLYLRDPAPGVQYARARITRRAYLGTFSYRLSDKMDGQIRYAFETRDYNRQFSERDNESHILGAEVDYGLTRWLKTELSYDFDQTLADGRNSPDSQVVDISNRAHRFAWGVSLRPWIWRKHPFQIAERVSYEVQKFTSERSLDRFHFRRRDHEWWSRTSMSLGLAHFLEIGLAYTFNSASANSSAVVSPAPPVSATDVSAFKRHLVSAQFTFSF